MDLVGKINEQEIKQRACDKAFSMLMSLGFEINSIKKDIENNNTGGVSLEEWIGVLDLQERNHQIWDYIFTLIEKDNKL